MIFQKNSSLYIDLIVGANATKNEVIGIVQDKLKIKVSAVRDKGRANEAVIDLLATTFNKKRSEVHIIFGATSTQKRIEIENLTLEEFFQKVTK